MFLPGTMVRVVASNYSKSGPRPGSTGFFISKCNGIGDYFKEDSVLGFSAKVMFNRYGYEETYRSESREVAVLIPIKTDATSKRKAYARWMDNKIETLRKSGVAQSIANNYKPDSYWVVLAMEQPIAVDKMDFNTWCAWFTSMLWSHNVSDFVSSEDKKVAYSKLPYLAGAMKMIEALKRDKAVRIDELRALMTAEKRRLEMINAIRFMVQASERKLLAAKEPDLWAMVAMGRVKLDQNLGIELFIKHACDQIGTPKYKALIDRLIAEGVSKQDNPIMANMANLRRWVCSPPASPAEGQSE